MASHLTPSDYDQRPGESLDEFAKRLASRSMEQQRHIEEIRRQTEEIRRQTEEIRREGEENRRQAKEIRRRMEKSPFLLYVDEMEDLVFSLLDVTRTPSKGRCRGPRKKPASAAGKMYPRSIRPWAGFAEQHAESFAKLRDTLGTEPRFPSSISIETIRNDLYEKTSFVHDINTDYFMIEAVEKPVASIVTAYLKTTRPDVNQKVCFQYNMYYIQPPIPAHLAQLSSPVKELQPDRWCVMYETIEVDGRKEEADDKTVNILVGEISPPYHLQASTLADVLSTMRHDTFFHDAIMQSPASEDTDAAEEPAKPVPGHVLVARALCQAYDYMIGSGCPYGYITTGECLVFLRVEDDQSLAYHFESFLVPPVQDVDERRRQNRGLRQTHETAVAYLASLCLWATQAAPRSFTWIDAATETALRWPESQKESENASSGTSDIDVDGTGGSEDCTGNSGPLTTPSIAMPPCPQKRSCSQERLRQGEQSQHIQRDEDKAAVLALMPTTRPLGPFPVEPPTLPYCTQACLRGLVRGQALDSNCPNVALHRDARLRAEGSLPPSGIYPGDLDVHPLTASALRARMVVQLAVNMDKDCQCAAPNTNKARYAKFFKLAVTGYGYTFVGKGVRAVSRKVLEHEAVVYNAVPHLQGLLIPVFLGIIDLQRPIPMPDMARIAHIMLMSYAGPDFSEPNKLPSDINVTREINRSTRDLERAGVYDPDVRDANIAWNAEVRRVMHFDFDRVYLSSLPDAPNAEEDQTERSIEAKRLKTDQDMAEQVEQYE